MTHAAIIFRISDLETGRVLGEAVVCAPVRYAAIRRPGTDRPSRCHAPAATWKEVDAELAVGLPSGPLEKSSAIAALLMPDSTRSSIIIQYAFGLPVEAEPALTIAVRLDAVLAQLIPAWTAPTGDPQRAHR